ncbi:MAG: hypothetical protein ACM3XN_09540 [Chloroflexota bacterium]
MLQLVAACCLGLLLTGYACGRRLGVGEGRHLGERDCMLRLREDAYEKGACPLCGRPGGGADPRRGMGI